MKSDYVNEYKYYVAPLMCSANCLDTYTNLNQEKLIKINEMGLIDHYEYRNEEVNPDNTVHYSISYEYSKGGNN